MRISRTIWILLANGTAVLGSYIASFFRFRALNNQNRAFWFHFALWAIVPILGIVLEFQDSRFARWVNIGYFTIVSAVMFGCIFLIHTRSRMIFIPLAAAGVTYLVYSEWWVPPSGPLG